MMTDAMVGAGGLRPRYFSPATRSRSNRLSRSGSASTSIDTIRPPATVSERMANGRPSGAQATPPGIPLTSTRVDVSTNRRNDIACMATPSAPRTIVTRPGRAARPSERTTTFGSSTASSRWKSPSRDAARNASTLRPLAVEIRVGHRRSLDAAAGTARELPHGGRRPADDPSDLAERHAEHVVQHEGHALGRPQGIEDGEKRKSERVTQERLLLGVGSGLRTHDRIRDVRVERRLTACPSRTEHVQAHAAHNGRQPSSKVFDVTGVCSAEPDPGLLHGVIRLSQGAEHAVCDRPQVGAVGFESLSQPNLISHEDTSTTRESSPCHIGQSLRVTWMKQQNERM
jgi:hypothetical protein